MTLSPLESLGLIQPTDHLIKRKIINEANESLHDLFGLMKIDLKFRDFSHMMNRPLPTPR